MDNNTSTTCSKTLRDFNLIEMTVVRSWAQEVS